ncbi:MAG: YhcN/YlaJ family sporulation lipoprotein [Sporolactobacillus sp.]
MKKTVLALGAALTMSGVLAGCGSNNAAYENPNGTQNVTYRTHSTAPNSTMPNAGNQINQVPTTYQMNSDKRLSKRIADQAAAVNGVKRAHVVVNNNNVLIGLEADQSVNRLGALRKSVHDAVKPLARHRHVYITTDRRYVTKITNLETRFNAGKGMNEFRSDVVGIINDLSNAVKRPFQNNSK